MLEFQFWPTSENWSLIIYLDSHWINNHARQISQCSDLFWPPLSITPLKLHDGVSVLSNFLELKFDHRFGCPFDSEACTWTFRSFWIILTPFKLTISKPTNVYDVWSYFGHHSRLVKQRFKRCYFSNFLVIESEEKLGNHLRENHVYKNSGDFDLFLTLVKLGQTNS